MRHIIHAPHLSRLTDEQKEEIFAKARESLGLQKNPEPVVIRPVPLWEELHRRALTFSGDDSIYLSNHFARRVPCGECRKHWLAMIAKTPPDFSRYFEWTVDRHNEVNTRIGKKVISYEAARQIWS